MLASIPDPVKKVIDMNGIQSIKGTNQVSGIHLLLYFDLFHYIVLEIENGVVVSSWK